MTVKRDRPLRVLELLAAADAPYPDLTVTWQDRRDAKVPAALPGHEPGLYITTLVEQAGEFVNQRTLTWFGHILRDAEARGWVIRTGQAKGGWQQGRPYRWAITPAGRQHVLDVQGRREKKAAAAKDEADSIRARNVALRKARRTFDKTTATRHEREQVTIMLRDAGVSWRDIGQLTGYSHQTARNDYENGQRQWPSRIAPRSRPMAFTPKSTRFPVISQVIADETGLTPEQAGGVLRVMHALGMTIHVPMGFRYREEDPEPVTAEPEVETAVLADLSQWQPVVMVEPGCDC